MPFLGTYLSITLSLRPLSFRRSQDLKSLRHSIASNLTFSIRTTVYTPAALAPINVVVHCSGRTAAEDEEEVPDFDHEDETPTTRNFDTIFDALVSQSRINPDKKGFNKRQRTRSSAIHHPSRWRDWCGKSSVFGLTD